MRQASGTEPVRHYKDGAVMGFTDVVRKLGGILGDLSECRKDILEWKPDVVILIDYPGFNMKIAEFCHKNNIKVYWYIAPKTWASREGRNRKLKAFVDKMFIVFPFEISYFKRKGIPFVYKGNPLLDAIAEHKYKNPSKRPYIAILAGSRAGEISRMMPVCMKVVDKLKEHTQYKDFEFIIAGAPSRTEDDYKKYIGDRKDVKLVFGRTYDVLKYASAAIINSGTASLEAAIIGTPQVVCWSTSALTYFIAARILGVRGKIQFISLGNLCLDKMAFRELIQDDFTSGRTYSEVRRLIEDESYRTKMIEDYAEIRRRLGGKGASKAVAAAMIEGLKTH